MILQVPEIRIAFKVSIYDEVSENIEVIGQVNIKGSRHHSVFTFQVFFVKVHCLDLNF